MRLFKTWCWAKSRIGSAMLTLVSTFLSYSVLKVKNTTPLGFRLFFSCQNQLQKVSANLCINICLKWQLILTLACWRDFLMTKSIIKLWNILEEGECNDRVSWKIWITHVYYFYMANDYIPGTSIIIITLIIKVWISCLQFANELFHFF